MNTIVTAQIYLQYLHHHLLIVGDVDGLKDFAVLAAAQLPHQLEVILVAVEADVTEQNISWAAGPIRKKKDKKASCCKCYTMSGHIYPHSTTWDS